MDVSAPAAFAAGEARMASSNVEKALQVLGTGNAESGHILDESLKTAGGQLSGSTGVLDSHALTELSAELRRTGTHLLLAQGAMQLPSTIKSTGGTIDVMGALSRMLGHSGEAYADAQLALEHVGVSPDGLAIFRVKAIDDALRATAIIRAVLERSGTADGKELDSLTQHEQLLVGLRAEANRVPQIGLPT
jgi:hypothetical protein